MAVAATAVWEVRAAGAGVSDNNGGAYDIVTLFSGSDLVVDGSLNTKVTSAGHNFVAADVGTRIQITGGTGWTTGFYTINSVASNAATLNASPAATGTTGGVWVECGQDYSQQNAPQVAVGGGVVTSSVTTNVITFTGGTYTPSNADVGNYLQVISGTNTTPGTFLRINSVGATTWTMDANVVSAGTQTNVVANMGGAILTLAKLAANMAASNKAFVTGAFSTNATITFAQAVTPTVANPQTRVMGYGAARGDATHATLTLTTNVGLTGINSTGGGFLVSQIDVNCANLGTSTGIAGSQNYFQVQSCKVANFATRGINMATTLQTAIDCEVTGGAGTAAIDVQGSTSFVERCFIHDNTTVGVKTVNAATVIRCLIVNNSGATTDGIQCTYGCTLLNNTIHNNGRHGINNTSANVAFMNWRNNLLTNNAGFGAVGASSASGARFDWDGNVYGGGASANTQGTRSNMDAVTGSYGIDPYVNSRDVILTGSPYMGPTTGTTANFALNDTAGAGRACKAAGAPRTWTGNTGSTGYPDAGAVQHKDGGGVWVITAP